jgi:hypothetical protein
MLDATPPSDLVDELTAFGSPEEGAWHPSDKDLQRADKTESVRSRKARLAPAGNDHIQLRTPRPKDRNRTFFWSGAACHRVVMLGRAAHGEEMVGGYVTDSWRVKRDSQFSQLLASLFTDE